MRQERKKFMFLNVGHFLDHYFMLIFATAAALRLTTEWGLSYAELIPYATPGFVAFGLFAIPAGWLADKWSRDGMMTIFFIGIGISSALTGMAQTPLHIALSLTVLGIFAAIYHPVGLALVVEGQKRTGMLLAINGVFGNMGVACAALLTGYLIDTAGWRSAFIVSGAVSVVIGVLYMVFIFLPSQNIKDTKKPSSMNTGSLQVDRNTLLRVFAIIFFTTAIGGLVFQSTTFALPKVFEERLSEFANTPTLVGQYAFLVFSIAAFAQVVVGILVDKHPVKIVFACVAVLQLLFFTLMIKLSGAIALVVAVAFMLAVFGQIPINDVLVGRMARSEWRSRAYALRYIVTFSVAASAVPLISWIHGTWGFDKLFALLAFAALMILIAVLLLPELESSEPIASR